jgi:lipoprotein NlpD
MASRIAMWRLEQYGQCEPDRGWPTVARGAAERRRECRAWRGNRAGGFGCRPVPADRFGPSGRRACRRDDQHASRCSGGACIGRGSQAATPSASASAPASDIRLAWPASGQLIGKFDEKRQQRHRYCGQKGDAVLAADEGRVIHVGPLRGYGNLVIIKHNDTYLTAYGHNDKVLVTEQSTVRKGQKIAEMGNSDTDRVKLHFEVRKNGKPVDPMRYLPPQ